MSAVDPITKHRRDVWLRIVLPVGLAAALLVLTLVILFTLAVAGIISPEQVNTISSIMLVVCVLFPLVLVMTVVALMFVAITYFWAKLPGWTTQKIRGLRYTITGVAEKVPPATERLVKPLVALDARLTRWGHFVQGLVGRQAVTTNDNQEGLEKYD